MGKEMFPPLELGEMIARVKFRRGERLPSTAFEIAKASAGERMAIAERVVREGLTHKQTVALVALHLATSGVAPRVHGQWEYRGEDGSLVVVTTPAGKGKLEVGRALRDAMSHLNGKKASSSSRRS